MDEIIYTNYAAVTVRGKDGSHRNILVGDLTDGAVVTQCVLDENQALLLASRLIGAVIKQN